MLSSKIKLPDIPLNPGEKLISVEDEIVSDTQLVRKAVITANSAEVEREYKFELNERRVPRAVAERRARWSKFGDCKGPIGNPEPGITAIGDVVPLEVVVRTRDQKKEEEINAAVELSRKDIKQETWQSRAKRLGAQKSWSEIVSGSGEEAPPEGEGDASGSSYVPPHLRAGGGGGGDDGRRRDRNDENTLRVTNLPEDVDEDMLRDLFGKFGRIMRCHVPYTRFDDPGPRRARGFAFISFAEHFDAEEALRALNNYGLNHMIIGVDWAEQK